MNSQLIAGGIASLLGLLVFAGLIASPGSNGGLEAVRADLESVEPIRKGATGDTIACGNGQSVVMSYAQEDAAFELVGTFEDVYTRSGLIIEAPIGETKISVSGSPDVEGEFYGGEVMTVSGRIAADGTFEAERIRPACDQAIVREVETDVPEVTAQPPVVPQAQAVPEQQHEPSPTDQPPVQPVAIPAPNSNSHGQAEVAQSDPRPDHANKHSDDKDDRDDDDKDRKDKDDDD